MFRFVEKWGQNYDAVGIDERSGAEKKLHWTEGCMLLGLPLSFFSFAAFHSTEAARFKK